MSPDGTDKPKQSKVETIKEASFGLAGTLAEVTAGEDSHFGHDDLQLLKFHGSYQQDDRDLRKERRRQKQDKAWSMMLRCKIPGGRLSADQYLAVDELAQQTGYQSLRITSRQGLQVHGVGKDFLKQAIKMINDSRLTTLGACGDVNRNTMCCGLVDQDERAGLGLERFCATLAEHFAPRTSSYWVIWCDGEKWGQPVAPNQEEPLYGKAYLPRKFKMAVAVAEDNCVDLYSQDIGIEAVHRNGTLEAYDLLVGGGMGYTHGQSATYPRLGTRLVRVTPEQALAAIETIVLIQRDHGDRVDRKHARLKYLIQERGADWMREELARRLGYALPEAGPAPERYDVHDHLGWSEGPQGNLNVGFHILNGRLTHRDSSPQMAGLRELVRRFRPEVRLTPRQNVVLVGLKATDRAEIERIIDDHGLQTDADISRLERLAMACPALPTCGLALAESERYLPQLLTELEEFGLGEADVEIRMTGCPNSCVRTPLAELAVVGRGPGKYALFLGGSQQGNRLAYLFQDTVVQADLVPLVQKLIGAWCDQCGGPGEASIAFGDWATAKGCSALLEFVGQG